VSERLRALAALGALAAACATPGREQIAVTHAPVVGGEPSPLGGIEDAVLMLRIAFDSGELVCTSSLVAPNLVLTARHCVSHFVDGNFSCTVQGELESVDLNAGVLGTDFDASIIEFYDGHTPRTQPIAHGAQVISTLSDTVCTNDLAFVVLDRALLLPVLPLRLEGRARRREAVTLVGYGFDDAMAGGDFLDVESQLRTHNANLTIDDVGPLSKSDVTVTPPRTVVIEGPSGCVGDSGGPLLANDTHALLAVDSLSVDGSCTDEHVRNLFTHVPDFQPLIDDAFAAAGYEPTSETPDEPGTMSEAGRGGAPDSLEAGGAPSAGTGTNSAGETATGGSAEQPPDGAGGSSATGGVLTGEGGAAPSDGGAPTTNIGGTPGTAHSRPSPPRASHGCMLAPGADPNVPAGPFLALMAVLERIFHVRRRRLFLDARLRRERLRS
jgi:hypothetical protein